MLQQVPSPANHVNSEKQGRFVVVLLATQENKVLFSFRAFKPCSGAHIPSVTRNAFNRSSEDWWHKTIRRVSKEQKKRVNSLIMLGAWVIWKHSNVCVFEGASPSVNLILRELNDDQLTTAVGV
jgi:hypothetical protein